MIKGTTSRNYLKKIAFLALPSKAKKIKRIFWFQISYNWKIKINFNLLIKEDRWILSLNATKNKGNSALTQKTLK